MRGDRRLMIPISLTRREDLDEADRFVYGALFAIYENVPWSEARGYGDWERPDLSELVEWTGLGSSEVYSRICKLGRLGLVGFDGPDPGGDLELDEELLCWPIPPVHPLNEHRAPAVRITDLDEVEPEDEVGQEIAG